MSRHHRAQRWTSFDPGTSAGHPREDQPMSTAASVSPGQSILLSGASVPHPRPAKEEVIMTGQARVLIRNYGTDIRLECLPCGINSPSYWPGATIRTALRAGDER